MQQGILTAIFLALALSAGASGQANTGVEPSAAADPPTFILYGFHSVSCLSWTQARTNNSEDALQYEAWVTGFLSGAGWRNAPIEQTDYAAINYHLDDYCKRYPSNNLFMATRALVAKLKVRNR